MEVIIKSSSAEVCGLAAKIIAAWVRKKPTAVLGLPTGSSPKQLYAELVKMHRTEGLDFSRVTTFNLDEYVGLSPSHPASYHRFMAENFFNDVKIPPSQINIPDGMAADIPAFCLQYEEAIKNAGGLDLQLLGIGEEGHIGFNEPTSSLSSRTRIKTLTMKTRSDNQRFFSPKESVPSHVITMGVGTIMDSRCCLLIAHGAGKAGAIARTVEGPVTAMCPASALQLHPRVIIIVDEEAASRLTLKEYYRSIYEGKPSWQRHEN